MERQLLTERLVLVPFSDEDAPALLAQWNDLEVRRYLFDDEAVPLSVVQEQIAASRGNFSRLGCGYFTLRLREAPDDVIGFAGLRSFGDPERIELLYALLPRYWGRGLATEASRAVLDHAFRDLGLSEVWAGADPPNEASFRVMERLGMSLRQELTIGGRLARYYGATRPDGLASPRSGR